MMLYKLLDSLKDDKVEYSVVSLMGRGSIAGRIESLGIPVWNLNLEQGEKPGWQTINKLNYIMREFRPHVVQGWMYHGNIAAILALFLCWASFIRPKLFWNVRQTLYNLGDEKSQTQWVIRISGWLSFLPKKIIYNSVVSAQQHTALGFLSKNVSIIPNGFDLNKFYPDQTRRKLFRDEIGISDSVVLIGHISRFHPMKDHATLLRAIEQVKQNLADNIDVVFLLVGKGVTNDLSSNPSIYFMGERADIPVIMSALDIVVSSSAWGEGFPNVVGEAMASEVACVVTDVGDSAQIVAKHGMVCPVGHDRCIAESLLYLIDNAYERKLMGKQARMRIKNNYMMSQIVKQYKSVWGI